VRIVDSSGTTIKSRVTSGIVEVGSSGFYIATIDLSAIPPPDPRPLLRVLGQRRVHARQHRHRGPVLGGVVPFATALRNLQAISNNYNGENLAVGIFNFT
jgi:hypothetical protein